MNKSRTEELIGGLVVAVLAIVLVYSHFKGQEPAGPADNGVMILAEFGRTDGLKTGADVRLSGITIGSVIGQSLGQSFRTVVQIRLRGDIPVPTDTAAVIRTDGMMGAKYVELEPGGAVESLSHGDRIEYTQDAVVLEELLDKILQMAKANRANRAKSDKTPAEPAPESVPDLMPGLAPDL